MTRRQRQTLTKHPRTRYRARCLDFTTDMYTVHDRVTKERRVVTARWLRTCGSVAKAMQSREPQRKYDMYQRTVQAEILQQQARRAAWERGAIAEIGAMTPQQRAYLLASMEKGRTP